ncbi:peroxiredoxin [Salsuginibacillus halophilus]|uniref:Peroxiredoxin n=1 Tax=Salsuginibacillus halophilus TaxID=517424 RepID=A0A2P8HWF5_9BACI|nr:TlpA disulfide reductase family protein [Salsuginibacillus halophilus]PSL50556.1 peroxiredoxin [Salsuginibacillus halophilus]
MQAPEFSLYNIKTMTEEKLSNFTGSPVVLTFFASWCPDAQADLNKKKALFEQMNHSDLTFVAINVTGREREEGDGKRYAENESIPFTVLLDEGTKTYDAYRAMGVPTTVLIKRNGEILNTYHDKSSFYHILQGIHELIEEA